MWAAEIWSSHREFFRPWERVQPARQNVWSEKEFMMELLGSSKGQMTRCQERRRKLARDRGGKSQSMGERENFRMKEMRQCQMLPKDRPRGRLNSLNRSFLTKGVSTSPDVFLWVLCSPSDPRRCPSLFISTSVAHPHACL